MNTVNNPLGQQQGGQQYGGRLPDMPPVGNPVGNPVAHPSSAHPSPGHSSAGHAASSQPAPTGRTTPWFGVSIAALVWSVLGLGGGAIVVMYLGLGVIMTNTLDGVFSPASGGGLFNWVLLWVAIIGQLLGLALSLLAAFGARSHRKKRRRMAKGAVIMGFISVGIFLLTGLIQIPLVGILFDALAL